MRISTQFFQHSFRFHGFLFSILCRSFILPFKNSEVIYHLFLPTIALSNFRSFQDFARFSLSLSSLLSLRCSDSSSSLAVAAMTRADYRDIKVNDWSVWMIEPVSQTPCLIRDEYVRGSGPVNAAGSWYLCSPRPRTAPSCHRRIRYTSCTNGYSSWWSLSRQHCPCCWSSPAEFRWNYRRATKAEIGCQFRGRFMGHARHARPSTSVIRGNSMIRFENREVSLLRNLKSSEHKAPVDPN